MWLLIECDDPTIDPGHNEKQRILLDQHDIAIEHFISSLVGVFIPPLTGIEMHPCTPGDTGYHCPHCHKDVPPSKLQGRGCGEMIIDDNISNLPGKIKIDKKDLDKLREPKESP